MKQYVADFEETPQGWRGFLYVAGEFDANGKAVVAAKTGACKELGKAQEELHAELVRLKLGDVKPEEKPVEKPAEVKPEPKPAPQPDKPKE